MYEIELHVINPCLLLLLLFFSFFLLWSFSLFIDYSTLHWMQEGIACLDTILHLSFCSKIWTYGLQYLIPCKAVTEQTNKKQKMKGAGDRAVMQK